MKRVFVLGWCMTASLAYADNAPVVSSTTTPSAATATSTVPPVQLPGISTPSIASPTTQPPAVSVPTVTAPGLPGVTVPPATSTAVPVATPAPAATLPGMKPRAASSSMNEMTGTVESIDSDEKDLRISVEGGFNVDFKYTRGSSFTENDAAIEDTDLSYGDKVLIRYVGRDLQARQVIRLGRAPGAAPPAPVPDIAPATTPTAAPATTPNPS